MKTIQKRISTEQKKLDRLIQLKHVPLNPKCLVCGSKTAEMHHFVQKKMSAYLRYDKRNLIPLCKQCHASHHLAGNPHIVASIVIIKGKEWEQDIQSKRNILIKRDKQYLEHLSQLEEKLQV